MPLRGCSSYAVRMRIDSDRMKQYTLGVTIPNKHYLALEATEENTMTKEQLLQAFVEAYEQLIKTAFLAAQRGMTRTRDTWEPREIVAHLVGWEAMASVRIPSVVAGMPPAEFDDPTQATTMNDAINMAFITLMGEQSLETLCGMLRQTYQQNGELLTSLEDRFFQPGEYVYERTKAVIEHCQEHMEQLTSSRS